MLTFEIEYLMGRVYAGDFRDRSEPEWPPHPARLFSALAAAYFESGENEQERKALEWLENQGAPLIHAPQPGIPEKVTAFVPTNYPGDPVPELRGKQPRAFPAQAPADAYAYFVWPDAEPESQVRLALDELASRAAYLGKACSIVRMCLAETAPEPNYVPDPTGRQLLRTIARGRLQELAWLFGADQRPSVGIQQHYRQLDAEKIDEEPIESVFGEMLIFRRVGGAGLPVEATLTLTDAVRNALMSNAGNGGPVPNLISGHGTGAHCAIVGLPFVGSDYADGRLMGFAIVLPRGVRPTERRKVLVACGALERRGVYLGKNLGSWEVALETTPLANTLRESTWTRPSRRWTTATPILLDRFPKRKGPTVEEILATACSRVGLPKPSEIQHGPFSKEEGVPSVPQFRLHRRKGEQARWGIHAELRFPEAIMGPVLLGAGRYFGLGLMRPIGDKKND